MEIEAKPVPPLAADNVPARVNVPELVIGPPVNVSPVELVALMLVTVPELLLLKVDQSAEESNPLLVDEAVGKLNVCTEPEEEILKSVPEVPVANVWVEVLKPLRLVIAVER